ncbi:MAG: c-type cytochrome [Oceanococcus sp.]
MRKLILTLSLCLSAGLAQAAGDVAAGQEKSATCAACHGADGVSASPAFPNLAGQHANYIEHALKQYQSGDRKNPIMAGQVANLNKQDIKDLAAYYSQQKGLYTPTYDPQ